MRHNPPKILQWLLKHLIVNEMRLQVLDDIGEMYRQLIIDQGKIHADRWYLKQVFRSFPNFVMDLCYWRMVMVVSYMKMTARIMKRHQGYSFINITGLTIGIACVLLVAFWVQHETGYDRFHENINNLHRVAFTTDMNIQFANSFQGEYLPGQVAEFLSTEYPEIKASTVIGGSGAKFTVGDRSFFGSGPFVHATFFQMFTFPFKQGDHEEAFKSPRSIVLSESFAERLFGLENPVGKTVRINDRAEIPVTGVLKKIPENSHLQFDYLLSFELAPRYMKTWDNKSVQVYVQLEENAQWRDVSRKISEVYNDHNPGAFPNYLFLQPMSKIRLHDLDGGGRINYIYLFSGLAAAILLIACFNFMNLSTAYASVRVREVGLKKVLGSSQMKLIGQFLGESITLTCIACGFALVIARLLLPSINAMLGEQIPFRFSWSLLSGIIGIVLLTGLVAGSYPAFVLSSFRPVNTLKGRLYSANVYRSSMVRRILVIGQFSCSAAFLIGIIIIFSQIIYFKNRDLGYDKENMAIIQLSGTAVRNITSIKNRLVQHPEVIGATVSSFGLAQWNSSAGLGWPGKDPANVFDVGRNNVDYDYLTTFKLRLTAGRFFSKAFPSDISNACVINEATVEAMGVENPIGLKVTYSPGNTYAREATVIGVVKNYHTESLHGPIRPFILFPSETGYLLNVRIQNRNRGEVLENIKGIIQEFDPNFVLSYNYLESQLDALYQEEYLTGSVVVYVAVIAVFLACLGLFGLVTFSVQRRLKEIGIRKALGASHQRLITLVSKEFFWLVVVANIIAWPISYILMQKWLDNFNYHVEIHPGMFLMAGGILLSVSLITVCIQSFKAAMSNPIDILRYE